jgi:hypothetical protein
MRRAIPLLAVLGVVVGASFVRADFDVGGQSAITKPTTQVSKPALKGWSTQELLFANLCQNGVAWLEVAPLNFVIVDRSIAGQSRRGPSNIPSRKYPRPQIPANTPWSW